MSPAMYNAFSATVFSILEERLRSVCAVLNVPGDVQCILGDCIWYFGGAVAIGLLVIWVFSACECINCAIVFLI